MYRGHSGEVIRINNVDCCKYLASTMSPARLRASIFPNVPPYLHFAGPDERWSSVVHNKVLLIKHFSSVMMKVKSARRSLLFTLQLLNGRATLSETALLSLEPGSSRWDSLIMISDAGTSVSCVTVSSSCDNSTHLSHSHDYHLVLHTAFLIINVNYC